MSDDAVTTAEIGQAAVRAALDEYERVVRDPEDAERIAHYHRAIGAGWTLEGGTYDEDSDFWCGVFAGYCHHVAGDYLREGVCLDVSLKEAVGKYFVASTSRLAGRWRPWADYNLPAPIHPDPSELRAGDLILVRTARTDRNWGDHVCLVEEQSDTEPGAVLTYEGNATGTLGDGSPGEGVICGIQRYASIAMTIRFRPAHYQSSLTIKE